MWRLNLPLVEKGLNLNEAQLYFLLISDPLYKGREGEIIQGEGRIFNELATGMPVDVIKEQLGKIGINYDEHKQSS